MNSTSQTNVPVGPQAPTNGSQQRNRRRWRGKGKATETHEVTNSGSNEQAQIQGGDGPSTPNGNEVSFKQRRPRKRHPRKAPDPSNIAQPLRAEPLVPTVSALEIDSSQAPGAPHQPSSRNRRNRKKNPQQGEVDGDRRANRGGHSNESTPNGLRTSYGRTFGAQLSSAQTGTPSQEPTQLDGMSELRPSDPTFLPGPRQNNRNQGRQNRGKYEHFNDKNEVGLLRGPEDLSARIHREIASGAYECMICYSGVSRRSKIWYCRCCWSVFHLHCLQKWAKQGMEKEQTRPVGADGPDKSWRCPACNNSSQEVPNMYTCWCEKTIQPESSKYVPPHSCGQTCGKPRLSPQKCPHVCNLQCHAGPCPPCTALGPPQPCYCANEESQNRCVNTDYEYGWSCGKVCGDQMPCGEHECPNPCHPGVCGECEHKDLVKCYCGSIEKNVKCCDQEEPVKSVEPVQQTLDEDKEEPDEWFGYFDCGKVCNRPYDCNIHYCEKTCHPLDFEDPHCPLSPDLVTHCPCGKTQLLEIMPELRENCQAPIPVCEKIHGKRLACGHECARRCHDGECGACLRTVKVTCRCGKITGSSLCHQGESVEPPICARNCRVALNCGRHECGKKCCSGEQKAQERLSVKKKMRAFGGATPGLQTDDGFEPEHICTRICGRLLKCGLHTCPMLCHRGPCGTCLEASFEELTCNCGRTSIQPPVPCGSKPPICRFPCTREKTCGHPIVAHDCHTDDDRCPKCPYLTEKLCTCGKKTVKAVPCFREVVSCGTLCGKKLSCGSHSCRMICHDGSCETPCKQECGKSKNICGHSCSDTCHAPFQCTESKACASKVQLQCSCGGIKQDIKCGSTKSNPTGNKKELKCTDQCRSRRLAMALQLDPERDGEPLYSDNTIASYNRDKKWSAAIEQKFRAFAENVDQKRLQFQPMRQLLRTFLHSLAEDYGLESESQDPEPYRSVVVRKGPKFTATPRKSISEYLSSRPTSMSSPLVVQQLKKQRGQAVNAFILQGIRVGLLASELEKELSSALDESQLRFTIGWHGDEDVLLSPKASSLDMDQIEAELRNICSQIKRIIASKGLAESAELCWVGQDGRVANKETERWSVVNNKRTGTAILPLSGNLASRNRFDMTVSPVVKPIAKKKSIEKPKEVVDDWEMEAEAEEADVKTDLQPENAGDLPTTDGFESEVKVE